MKLTSSNRGHATASGTTLVAATDTDLLPGGTSGMALGGGNVVEISLTETGGILVDTVTVKHAPTGGAFATLTALTTSLAASGSRSIILRGLSGSLRVIANSVDGSAVAITDVAVYDSGASEQYRAIIDGSDVTESSLATAIASLQTSIENNNVWVTDSRGSHLVTRGAR